jgi:hypothetical protein
VPRSQLERPSRVGYDKVTHDLDRLVLDDAQRLVAQRSRHPTGGTCRGRAGMEQKARVSSMKPEVFMKPADSARAAR